MLTFRLAAHQPIKPTLRFCYRLSDLCMDNHQSTSMSFYIQTSSAGHWGHVISVSDLWIKQKVLSKCFTEFWVWLKVCELCPQICCYPSGKIIFAIREMLKMKRLDVQDQKHTHMHSPQRLSAGWGPKAWTHRQRKGGQPTIWAHGGCVCVLHWQRGGTVQEVGGDEILRECWGVCLVQILWRRSGWDSLL